MGESPRQLAHAFAEVARVISGQRSVELTLERIVALAVDSIDAADASGVLLVRDRHRTETPAATEDYVEALDSFQHQLREGPCWDATWDHAMFVVDDMAAESRWPRFCPRAAELGVGSMAAYRLFTDDGVIGALNVYAAKPQAFDESTCELGWIFASHAAVALGAAQQRAQLHEAIGSRELVAQAIGILMERHRVTAEQAFDVLSQSSQDFNTKLRDVARRVIETGEQPPKRAPQ